MKFATYAALLSLNFADAAHQKTSIKELVVPQANLAEEGVNAQNVSDYTQKYNYEIDGESFTEIESMLGTPATLTEALHNMFNQIHFNERVMR